jgi:hypothetical protein
VPKAVGELTCAAAQLSACAFRSLRAKALRPKRALRSINPTAQSEAWSGLGCVCIGCSGTVTPPRAGVSRERSSNDHSTKPLAPHAFASDL